MIIGFIGAGKLATALAHGFATSGAVPPERMLVSSRTAESREKLCAATGARAVSNHELAENAGCIVVCVKPAQVTAVLQEIQPRLRGKLLVSVAAGITLPKMREAIGFIPGALVRAMPNTGVLIGRSATALCAEEDTAADSIAFVESLFRSVGTVIRVPESMMDAVTGLSGSGPAYVFTFLESLIDGGVLMGLPREVAAALAQETIAGAVELVRSTGKAPAELRAMVTSPGGTTIHGLEALEQQGFRAAVMGAVRGATERSRAL